MNNSNYAGHARTRWTKGLALAPVLALLALAGCRKEPPAIPPTTPAPAPPTPRLGASDPGTAAGAAAAGPVGAVEGRVSVRGSVAPQAPLPTSPSVTRQCGAEVPDRSVVVAQDGGLAFAVVSLAEGESPAPAGAPGQVAVDQKGCSYEPPVVAARAGGTLELRNSDPLIHNVRAQEGGTPLFNLAMPLAGMKLLRQLPAAPGQVTLHCDVHPWMRAVVKTFGHPWFAVTDARGHYRLEGLPAGRHELVFWHERFPEKRVQVQILPGGQVRQDLEWPAGELEVRH